MATQNMGLGKLKGVFQERKSRLDQAIESQTGGAKPAAKKSKFPSKQRSVPGSGSKGKSPSRSKK